MAEAKPIVNAKEQKVFTDILRERAKGILEPTARWLNRMGVMPNTVTIAGLLGNAVGAYFLARGQMTLGGIFVLLMGPVDALDGAMARLRGEPSEFGAFVDSVTDRYSELVIFLGLMYFYLQQGEWLYALLTYLAAAGSVLVSYVRARAQSVGYEAKTGVFSRLGRYLVLTVCLIFNIPVVGLGILAVFANLTALQRILDVRRQARRGA
ncbi:MAG: CDP-alcohol phosphatidyltransferase family protein [Anaerolineales bacterium]|nr:CDP-alcohol phosphatidyltransferase family protein [Anaerolineales bacterium]